MAIEKMVVRVEVPEPEPAKTMVVRVWVTKPEPESAKTMVVRVEVPEPAKTMVVQQGGE